jgi:hypothetical protein
MDKEIYANDSIGKFMNERFISVRLQMDTSAQDDPEISAWYATAHKIKEKYHIGAYPSYLFFTPDGQALHIDFGFKRIHDFMGMGKAALDPNYQYFTLLENFNSGKRDYSDMPYLAYMTGRLRKDSLTVSIVTDYMHNYLAILPDKKLWTKRNIDFINDYARQVHSADSLFKRYYKEKSLVDFAMADSNYSEGLINRIIYREEVRKTIDIAIASGFEPNWHKIQKAIATKYSRLYVTRNVIRGRVEFYRETKTWSKYASYFIRQMELAGLDNWPSGQRTSLALNNDAFEVFLYSKRKKELQKGLAWVDRALTMNAQNHIAQLLDTKANLLYKLGMVKEGEALEAQSHAKAPNDKGIAESFEKMKTGLPTWPVQ